MVDASAKSGGQEGLLPRMLAPRLEQLRRDLRSVVASFRGERPPSWLARDGSRYVGARVGAGLGVVTRELEVAEVIRETADAVSLVLRDPSGALLPPLRPGQFFTVLVPVAEDDRQGAASAGPWGDGGQALRRAYSISSDARVREQVAITIKRVAEGRASNWLNDQATPGMRLRVLGPSGEFGCEPQADRPSPRKLVLIAGGSGITPMMALLRTLPAVEDHCELALIYGNRRADDVIFAAELAALAQQYGPRVRVRQALEQPPPDWGGAVGRLDADTLAGLLDAEPLAVDPQASFLLCGPEPMLDAALALLAARGVDPERIQCERFTSAQADPQADPRLRQPQPLTVVVDGEAVGLIVAPGQTLLEAGLAAGLPMAYSCAMGGCGACKVSLERGEVIMREPNCLGPSERARGLVLACVGSPVSPCRVALTTPEAG